MHNRDLVWTTRERRNIKIRDMQSSHLENTIRFINNHIDAYNKKFSITGTEYIIHCMKQELRLRKLNKLNIESNNEDLF